MNLAGLSHDEAEWAPTGTPRAACSPQSTEDVQRAVRACAASARCSPRTSACPARSYRPCSPASKRSARATACRSRPSRTPATATCTRCSTTRIAAQAAFADIIDEALALGGTVTGEHGVGLLKRDGMIRELGPDVCAVQQAVKRTLDPLDLFNPGKA